MAVWGGPLGRGRPRSRPFKCAKDLREGEGGRPGRPARPKGPSHSQMSVLQNDVQQGAVNFHVTVVGDEPQLAELVHEEIDSRASGAD